MKLFGHFETVPVRGTERKATVYVSSLLKDILISLTIAAVPFAIFFSGRSAPEKVPEGLPDPWFLEFIEDLHDPWFLGFTLVLFLVSLMVFWGNRLFAKDVRRMVAGELVARTGVLWAIGQGGSRRYPGPWRLVIDTQDAAGNTLRNEIYDISEELYRKHMAKRAPGGRGYAWLVELAVLPVPEGGQEFTQPSLPTAGEADTPLDPMGFGEMPVSRAVVADIFYLEQQPYGCSIDDRALFPHR